MTEQSLVTFIVPLKAPERSRCWRTVSALACRTIASICQQTSKRFHAILVGNRAPDGLTSHPNLTVLEEAFPLPSPEGKGPLEDKYRKIKRGLVEARAGAPSYVMIVDADDLVSNQIVAWADRHRGTPGWYGAFGYLSRAGSPWLVRKKSFHLLCGSSHLVWLGMDELPDTMAAPERGCPLLVAGHHLLADHQAAAGRPLSPLPFPIAIYSTGHGDNWSGMDIQKWQGFRMGFEYLTGLRYGGGAIRREFGWDPAIGMNDHAAHSDRA